MRRWALSLIGSLSLVALTSGAAATPIPVTFFHSPADDGIESVASLPVPGGDITLHLWADPTSAAGGLTFEVQDVVLEASGGVSIVSFTCDSGQGGCLAGTATGAQVLFTAGDASNGNAAPFTIGTLVLNVTGAGALSLIGGTALDGEFNGDAIIPHVVITFAVPEPAMLALLSVAAGGAALARRPRRA
ncbi:MAG TPA: PEP-CTERM sorting domain-containing protein [Myxococcota bacterium]|nr:PEP-CTERM sorting domain-containing protein [Myxococcota bacterium]